MSTTRSPAPEELPYRGMMPALGNPGEPPILWASLDGVRQNTFEYYEYTEAAQDAAEPEDEPRTLQDDRVVDDALACACGRPAGADGQCIACSREYAGEAIGNHGGRL